RHRFRGDDHRSLAAVVPGQSGARPYPGCAGDVDETAAASDFHGWHGVDGAPVNAFHIDGVDLVEFGLAYLQHGAVTVRPARIVDHGVELAVDLHRVGDQGFHLLALVGVVRNE